jgi:hypothetical protein
LILDDFGLNRPADVGQLIQSIKDEVGYGCVVFIDTLNQAAPGSDENSSKDMSQLLAAAKKIYTALKGLVILVHHSGKDTRQGLRGHSSMKGAVDTSILVGKTQGGGHKWSIDKSKDGDYTVRVAFNLVALNIGKDSAGLPETSCAVSYMGLALPSQKPLNGHQKTVYEAIEDELMVSQVLTYDQALDLAKSALVNINSNNRADRTRAALDSLITNGHLIQNEKELLLAQTPNQTPKPSP